MSTIRRCRIVLPSALLLFANWNDTSRGIDPDRLRSFPLTAVRAGLLRDGQNTSFDGLVATDHDGEVILRGKATSGKSWVAHFGEVAFDQVYRNDLDGNGMQDYVVYGLLPFSNGRTAPSNLITLLLMDTQGLPTPFETYVYDLHPEHGPRVLFDLLHDGHAQLLISSYDEGMWDGRVEVFCSGHWVNQLLEPKDMRWVEFRGNAGGWSFPLVHRWSYWPECALESPRQVNERILTPQRSTSASEISNARITSAEESATRGFRITPSPGCLDFRVDTVVYDHPADRQIALYNPASDYKTDLLRRMQKDRAHVRLYGVKYDADQSCRANMLWGGR
jgi:hypothetical protein